MQKREKAKISWGEDMGQVEENGRKGGRKGEERGRKGGRKGGGRAFPYVYVCFISVYGG